MSLTTLAIVDGGAVSRNMRVWDESGAGTGPYQFVHRPKARLILATASAMTRPANTTAYTALDAVSNNATAASVTPITLTVSDTNDDPIVIERVRIVSTDTGPATKQFRVYLFNADPTASTGVGGGDNSAWSQKLNGFVGSLLGTFRAFSDGSVAICTPDEGSHIACAPVSGAKTIYALLQSVDGFTPAANSTTFTLTAEGAQGAA